MGLKAFLLIVLAILLVITSEVAARKLVQRSITSLEKGTTSEVNDAKFLGLPVGGGGLPGIGGGGGGLPGIGGDVGGLPGIGGIVGGLPVVGGVVGGLS
ncbi:shematrin-like protein 2 [Solanum tuberosum]|uniref:Glycine-rich protein n=1 Tax=Solanum tuberosum TaxID=4113 RepID=M1D476_SOLTU|nr:PREDICTED: shematrin-like protein 2 [Solanum tuberosum]